MSRDHFLNALKYALTMAVVVMGLFETSPTAYVLVIVLVSLYKWWWDVVMDWGLLAVIPTWDNVTALFTDPSTLTERK
jgi:hypothetical protein